jgi:hypothetical protein
MDNMNTFTNLVSSKNLTTAEIYKKYANEILIVAKVPISDASTLKATVYLLFAQLASIHLVTRGTYQEHMDLMVEEVQNSVAPLSMRIGELTTSFEELESILGAFPIEADITEDTNINGLAGFSGLYFPCVADIVTDMGTNTDGVQGYAAIRVLEGIRGKGNGQEGMIEVALKLTEMTGELLKTLK